MAKQKRQRRRHAIKKLPPGRAEGAEGHVHSAQSTGGKRGYTPENEASDSDLTGCVALWRAVLAQAVMDAKSRRTKPEYFHIRHTAVFWLLENETDFNMVCDFAGLDPQRTRRSILNAQERGFNWRAGDGLQPTKHEREGRSLRSDLADLGISTKTVRQAVTRGRGFAKRAVQLELEF